MAGAAAIAQSRRSNKAAIEASEIALEGLIGQFWDDQKTQAAIAAATPK